VTPNGANKTAMEPRGVLLNLCILRVLKQLTKYLLPITWACYLCGSSSWRGAIINNFDKRTPFITQIQWHRLPRLMTAAPICFN